MRRRLPTALAGVLLGAGTATVALAQEFWVQPASFRALVGAPVALRLLVGSNFGGTAWRRPTRRVRRFVRMGPSRAADSTDLRPALLADSLAPVLRCPTPGTHVVVLTSQLAFSELPADSFTAYLRAAGLDAALRQRLESEATAQPGREAYYRCAKALVLAQAGPASPPAAVAADTAFRRVLALPLEFVPEQNPYRLRPGMALTVRVLRQGQPVPGALVHVWDASLATAAAAGRPASRQGPLPLPAHITTRTNAQGRLLVRLPGAGPYLLAAVSIAAAPASLASRVDWLSTWATLTFGGPAPLTQMAEKGYYRQPAN